MRVSPALGRRALAALLLASALAAAACDPNDLEAVGVPGGVFRPGAGCALDDLQAGGAQSCREGAQLGFERLADAALVTVLTPNLTRTEVSCRRSFCGTGSLALHADFRWREGQPAAGGDTDRLGEIRHRFPEPVDLYGKTLTFSVYVDGPITPLNAYIAVTERGGRFRMVEDGVIYRQFRDWSRRGAAIRADNAALALDEGQTSLFATEILISVYLATPVRTGDRANWSGEIYLDEIRWQ